MNANVVWRNVYLKSKTMLTIFSVPKPFTGHIGIIQRNAIISWSLLHPDCQIILCGDEAGTEEIAAEVKAKWIPDVSCNEYGTPFLNSVFDQVRHVADCRFLCYVNADIILVSDFMEAMKRIQFREFLVLGQRWDIDLTKLWDFDQPDWEDRLRRFVVASGALHPPWGSDYFVFPRDSAIGVLPEFVVGRAGWDNWVIFNARRLSMAVIDVTRAVTAIHQNHGYDHVADPKGYRSEGREADWNIKVAGNASQYKFSPIDATHVMICGGVLPALGCTRLQRRLITLPILIPSARPLVPLINLVTNLLRCLGGTYSSIRH